MTMGHPTQDGGHTQAASMAQQPEKTFPPDTDPGPVSSAMSDAMDADASFRGDSAQPMGSPVVPEIRQTTPVADMGEGYREATETDPH